LVVAIVLVTAGAAGCIGGGDAGDDVDTASSNEGGGAGNDAEGTNTTNATGSAETSTEPAGPNINRTVINGSIEGFAVPGVYYRCTPTGPCDVDFDLTVTNETTAVLVEVAWNQSANMWLDLNVPFEHCEQGPAGFVATNCPDPGTASGGSPLVIEVTDEEMLSNTGQWDGSLFVDEPTPTQVDYTLYVTTVSGGPLPSDYSNVQG
jgi:hypothetical protein